MDDREHGCCCRLVITISLKEISYFDIPPIDIYLLEGSSSEVPSMGPAPDLLQDDEVMETSTLDDEINNLLLRYEKSPNKDKVVIPGDDSDSDNRSDDSDVEPTNDDEAALLAATFPVNEKAELLTRFFGTFWI